MKLRSLVLALVVGTTLMNCSVTGSQGMQKGAQGSQTDDPNLKPTPDQEAKLLGQLQGAWESQLCFKMNTSQSSQRTAVFSGNRFYLENRFFSDATCSVLQRVYISSGPVNAIQFTEEASTFVLKLGSERLEGSVKASVLYLGLAEPPLNLVKVPEGNISDPPPALECLNLNGNWLGQNGDSAVTKEMVQLGGRFFRSTTNSTVARWTADERRWHNLATDTWIKAFIKDRVLNVEHSRQDKTLIRRERHYVSDAACGKKFPQEHYIIESFVGNGSTPSECEDFTLLKSLESKCQEGPALL